jgi:formylglycine-generating enzyme required for sulfatase activity
MGSENGDDDQKPTHRVTIRNGFFMGRTEVTQAQWQAVMGTTVRQQRDKGNPSWDLKGEGDSYPINFVSWLDAQEFIQKLNKLNDGFVYRLPTEAEWEYACRAGTTGDYAGNLESMAWYGNNSGNSYIDALALWRTGADNINKQLIANGNTPHPVATKQPNAFGLYDMHGNVDEWCEDYYHESYVGAPLDGNAWLSGEDNMRRRVTRGGGYDYYAEGVSSGRRGAGFTDSHYSTSGFRIVAVMRAS